MAHPVTGWVGAAVAAGLAGWGLSRLRTYLDVGAGYKAKVLCTAWFGSGRQLDPTRADQVRADAYWLLRPFRAAIDVETRSVSASLLGRRVRTAVHRDGLGATLLARGHAAAVLGPAPTARHRPRHEWPRADGSARLKRVVDAAFEEPQPRRRRRTYAVVVAQDGHIVAEQYAAGVTADTPLPGWSMAKSVMNALVGLLVDEGRLALDGRELLPPWRAPDPRAAITLEDLLRMRSGLRFSESYGNPWSDVLHMLYVAHDASGYAASRPLAFAPGTVWSYASGTTNILSRVMRTAVGDSVYHEWPRRRLFDAVDMQSAVLEPDGAGTFIGSSYMLATARDWARFGQLWLDRGRWHGRQVLSDPWVRFSTTATPQSPEGRYGAHWWLKLNPDVGGDSPDASRIAADAFFAVGHEGQTLTVVPSRRLVIVRLGASIHIDAWNQASFTAAVQDALG